MNTRLIKAKMALAGIKQGELAEKIGMDKSTLSRKINGQAEFTRTEIEAIANALHADVKELFFNQAIDDEAIV